MVDKQIHTRSTQYGQEVDIANVGNPRGEFGVRSHFCVVCRLAFKETKMRNYQGNWYGVPCGCHRDIPSLRRKNKNLQVKNNSVEEVH